MKSWTFEKRLRVVRCEMAAQQRGCEHFEGISFTFLDPFNKCESGLSRNVFECKLRKSTPCFKLFFLSLSLSLSFKVGLAFYFIGVFHTEKVGTIVTSKKCSFLAAAGHENGKMLPATRWRSQFTMLRGDVITLFSRRDGVVFSCVG